MNCIYCREQYKIIYNISFIILGTSMYAIYNGYYDLSLCSGGVFLTSINYWRSPVYYSWQRYLDVSCVRLALMYHLYTAYKSEYMIHYYSLTFLAISFYPLGIYYYKKKMFWHSIYAHSALHIIANIANIFLYSGKITPR
jgi:hypothetical protein